MRTNLTTGAGLVLALADGEEQRHEAYGTVAVWRDVAGNTWDLLGG